MVDPQCDNRVKMALVRVVDRGGREGDVLLAKSQCFLTVAINPYYGLCSKGRPKLTVPGERAKQT